jgi:hypothetical protein
MIQRNFRGEEMNIRVTFDSNAWETLTGDPDHPLREPISSGEVIPFICEIALSMESIKKSERSDFARVYVPQLIEESSSEGSKTGSIHMRLLFGPDNAAHPGLHKTQIEKLKTAKELGFKILVMTNIGTARCPDIDADMKIRFSNTDEFWIYAERLRECSDAIERLDCGGATYHLMSKQLRQRHWTDSTDVNSDHFRKKFAKAVAEWCDGESLSAHYAIGNDIFCTEDLGINAGRKSIFHADNFEKIEEKLGVRRMTMEELMKTIRQENRQISD